MKIMTLEQFEEVRDAADSPERRTRLTTLRCGCGFLGCYGWVVEDLNDNPLVPRPWQALPEFIGPLEKDPEWDEDGL